MRLAAGIALSRRRIELVFMIAGLSFWDLDRSDSQHSGQLGLVHAASAIVGRATLEEAEDLDD